MKKKLFTDGWSFQKKGAAELIPVLLPHDAMIHETRMAETPGGGAHGYFPGGEYIYKKKFVAPDEWKEQTVSIEFEGIYRNAKVYINDIEAGGHIYGYTGFLVCMDSYLRYGEENVIRVEVDNSMLPNSRWYSGSGIYRPVNLLMSNLVHIAYQGVKITTLSYAPAKIRIEIVVEDIRVKNGMDSQEKMERQMQVYTKISDESGNIVAQGDGTSLELVIDDAKLWSDETPYLYECHVSLADSDGVLFDEVTERFGVRMISWSNQGLLINGKHTLLRGGCFHHDNGILGAATWAKSEERRVRIMKELGFNALRSSHNPTSTALIEACDKYGMYLMDETFDMWYLRKSKYDYGMDYKKWWKTDTRAMVERDYNHPSVIMYSIGNEVSEPGKEEGVKQGKEMIDFIKTLDTTRAVTGGMNLLIMSSYAKGKGQYDNVDKETEKKPVEKENIKKPKNASLVFNMMASLVGPGMNKACNSDKVDIVTTPILDALDIAGYNYGSGRYAVEKEKHPNRVIVGSETYPYEIYKNWEMVKKYPYLIGDFMWTAWDYLGEAGLGAWSYTGGMPFNRPFPWILGGCGVIDILGNPDASCKYVQVVWEQEKRPVIGVRPVNHPGVRVSKSVWRGTNAMESWSWKNCEGNKAEVEVYSKDSYVELFLNDSFMGKKKFKKDKAMFHVRYMPGVLKAITYDEKGKQVGQTTLSSSVGKNKILLQPEETTIKAGDIVYIPISIVGENGIIESNADELLSVEVEGGVLLAFGSANPCTEESYDSGRFTTYYGRALAVVYAANEGVIKVRTKGTTLSVVEVEVGVQ